MAFESRILTGAMINSKHIEPRQFLENAREIVFERVRTVLTKYDNIKINTMFNGEFVASDKRANSVSTKNYKLFRSSELQLVLVARCRAYFNIAGEIPRTR